MKHSYPSALRVRLLYGVIAVLTTSLLIVGGAYRLQTWEAQSERNAFRAQLQQQRAEIAALRTEVDAEKATPKKVLTYDHGFGTDESASRDRRYYLPAGVALLEEGLPESPNPNPQQIRDRTNLLEVYRARKISYENSIRAYMKREFPD